MEIKLSKEDIEAIASSVAVKLEKSVTGKPIVYSVREVADILKCHKNTVFHHIHFKMLKAGKKGKSYFITQENLNKYLNEDL